VCHLEAGAALPLGAALGAGAVEAPEEGDDAGAGSPPPHAATMSSRHENEALKGVNFMAAMLPVRASSVNMKTHVSQLRQHENAGAMRARTISHSRASVAPPSWARVSCIGDVAC